MSEPSKPQKQNRTSGRDEKVYSKNQLWIRISIVAIVNLVLLLVWCFTTRTDVEFISHFSFASTVTSIILSVLAIFMSVTGESKTQAIRDRIEEEADDIIKVTDRLEGQIKDISEKITIVVHSVDNLKATISDPKEKPQIASGNREMIPAVSTQKTDQR